MSVSHRILYVDDDPANLDLLAYWLKHDCGYEITTAVSGHQASQLIEKFTYDLYLLDYCLTDTTAISLCRKIRQKDRQVPIIIYSALDRDIDRRLAARAGADLFLVKPDDLDQLSARIRELLDRKRTRLVIEPVRAAAIHTNGHSQPRVRSSAVV